jgi:2'-5' RNA ligase
VTDALFAASALTPVVYSLNVPVPGAVAARATDLARSLPTARMRQRGEHTLVAKRLGGGDAHDYHRIEARTRDALAGTPPFGARISGVDVFAEATTGPSPVVYLAVDSPELERLHARMVEAFEPVPGMEGEEYTPHVTVARGGSLDRARTLELADPIEWTVDRLELWDADRSQSVSTVSLPA